MFVGIVVLFKWIYCYDYCRFVFGYFWDDCNDVLGGYNGCDICDDIFDWDLVDKIYVLIKWCLNVVVIGILCDLYINIIVVF